MNETGHAFNLNKGKSTDGATVIRTVVLQLVLLYSFNGLAVLPTGGVFLYLHHHLDLASEDSVGHSTCMSVLTLTLTLTLTQTALSRCCYGRWGTAESPTHSPATRLHVL